MINNIFIRLVTFSAQKILFLSLILGAIYYFMFFNDGSKIEQQIAKIQKDIDEQSLKEKEADAALREVEQVRATVGALSEQFKTVSQALPSEVQMADIIRTVDTVSRASGVSIKTKEPRPIVNRDFFEEIPLKVTMEGSYSELTMFLYYLASTERIMKVSNFVMAQQLNTRDKNANTGRLQFEGQVISYRFVKQSEEAANAAAKPGAKPGAPKPPAGKPKK